MSEQELVRGVRALRVTVENAPVLLDRFTHFFSDLNRIYGTAVALQRLYELGQYERLDDLTVENAFTASLFAWRPSVENLSMRSPLQFDLVSISNEVSYGLGFLYLLLKAPEKVAGLPALHAKWHEGRLKKEILKAQRDEFRRRVEAGEIDVIALGFPTESAES